MVENDKIALDTNIVIDILNGKDEMINLFQDYQDIYLPVTVCGELLFGAKNSQKRQANELNFQNFINKCKVLIINKLVADEYAEIRKRLKDAGCPIPENDIWIAATCKLNDITLATRDKHFDKIEGLSLLKVDN